MNLSLYLLTVLIWGTTWIALKLQMGVVAIPLSIVYRFARRWCCSPSSCSRGACNRWPARPTDLPGPGLCLFCVNFMCFSPPASGSPAA
jgi:hypothetical protein